MADLVLWQRTLAEPLVSAISALDTGAVDDLSFTIDLPISGDDVAANLVIAGYDEATAKLIGADAVELARHLAGFSGCKRMKLRLEIIENDACRRFHADYVTYRLLTTYRGPGTQWIRTGEADSIAQLQPGDVAILKGRLLTDEPAVLHRSPPIAGQGIQRLVLVLDPVMPA